MSSSCPVVKCIIEALLDTLRDPLPAYGMLAAGYQSPLTAVGVPYAQAVRGADDVVGYG